MVQGEEWSKEYQRTRYLRKLPDKALKDRLDALTGNLWSTDAAGNVTPNRIPENRNEILRLILHTFVEQVSRSEISYCDLSEQELREAASAGYTPPVLRNPFLGSPSCFAKFGQHDHILDAYENGVLRIAPAALYNDPSLNSAQVDNELEHHAVTPNQHILFRMHGVNDEGEEVVISPQPLELFRYLLVQNFYVWCCGLGYDARLFHEFQADAVLVIRDKEAFRSRLLAAVNSQLSARRTLYGPLQYYDPYNTQFDQLRPIFSKNMRYLYQNEYRFAWEISDEHEPNLEPFFVELGSLDDIAEFLELSVLE